MNVYKKEILKDQETNMRVDMAIDFYNFDTLAHFEKAQRGARLLATAIYFNLDTREAAQLEEETRERMRGGE